MHSRLSTAVVIAVALGSAAGGLMRHAVSAFSLVGSEAGLPWPTLAVNVAGSYIVGLLLAAFGPYGRIRVSVAVQAGLIAGLCGGLTTFSAFSLEMVLFPRHYGFGLAMVWVVASMFAWLAAVSAGYATGRCIGHTRVNSRDS